MPIVPDQLRDSRLVSICDSLLDAATGVAGSAGSAGPLAALEATQLMGAVRTIAQLRRHVDQRAALSAGEVAHRSRRELGHQGMAQQTGFVNPVAMIQSVAQVSKHEATRLAETGALLAEVEASRHLIESFNENLDPWAQPGSGTGPVKQMRVARIQPLSFTEGR